MELSGQKAGWPGKEQQCWPEGHTLRLEKGCTSRGGTPQGRERKG